ncbi:MAG: prepilin peptidase, partial [Henriciella sp.]
MMIFLGPLMGLRVRIFSLRAKRLSAIRIVRNIREAVLTVSPIDLFFILSGPFIGSFIGMLAFRLPESEPWIAGRSKCRNCARSLTWFELIPVVSWIALRGRCRTCGAPVPGFYAVCEFIAAIEPVTAYFFAPEQTFVVSCL